MATHVRWGGHAVQKALTLKAEPSVLAANPQCHPFHFYKREKKQYIHNITHKSLVVRDGNQQSDTASLGVGICNIRWITVLSTSAPRWAVFTNRGQYRRACNGSSTATGTGSLLIYFICFIPHCTIPTLLYSQSSNLLLQDRVSTTSTMP